MSRTSKYSHLQLAEFNAGDRDSDSGRAVTFTADGKHLISGYEENILGVWRLRDGQQVATMRTGLCVQCVAASKDGRYIAAGTWDGELWVWDAKNYKEIFTGTKNSPIWTIDFSPDSTRLVTAERPAAIWDIVAHRKVRTFKRSMLIFNEADDVFAAKYSPRGDQIAAISYGYARVWDSNDGCLLLDIKVEVDPLGGLFWIDNHFFVAKNGKIKQIDASTGSTVSEWSVPQTEYFPLLALPHHKKFIACATTDVITFWDATTHTQLGLTRHIGNIASFSFSPDDQLLVTSLGGCRRIIVKMLPFITLETHIDDAALDAWRHGQLTKAEELLTAAIPSSQDAAHILASRALVRARLRKWDIALIDANESLKIQQSVVGYVAKCTVLVGKGEMDQGLSACDIAFKYFRSDDHVTFLLLVKAVVLFMAGEHVNAISRMDDLITDAGLLPALYVIQANMHLLHGNLHMESGNYERAVQLFVDARVKLGERTDRPPLIISLISGWKFDDLEVAVQQRLSQALLEVGRTKETRESALHMFDHRSSSQRPNMHEPEEGCSETWIPDMSFVVFPTQFDS